MVLPDNEFSAGHKKTDQLDLRTLAAIAMTQAATSAAGPVGRLYANVRPVNVRIDQSDIEIAKALGGGNVSEGLRVALKLIAQALHANAAAPERAAGGERLARDG